MKQSTKKNIEIRVNIGLKPLSANPTKWSNTLMVKHCLSVFDHFVGLALKELNELMRDQPSLVPRVWSLTGPVL